MTTVPAADPSDDILLRSDAGGVATLTLNRPAQRNALSMALMGRIREEIRSIEADATVRAVVIAANGPAYSGGHDLKEMRAEPRREDYEAVFARCSDMMMSLVRLPKPVIAKVHAPAMAAGCQLVATCDMAVASDLATFGTPGVNIGLFCSTPMVALTRNVPRKQAMKMLITGEPIDAKTALAYGLVNRVVPADQLDAAVDALTQSILAKSPVAVAIGKEAFYRQMEMGLSDAYAYTSEAITRNLLARDAEQGIDAFIAKRPMPPWEGR